VRTVCFEKSFILRRAAASGLPPVRTVMSTSCWSATTAPSGAG